jgi:hypothetical protein
VPVPPDKSHEIPLDVATDLCRRHRQQIQPVALAMAAGVGPTVFAEGSLGGVFTAAAVKKLLAQNGCKYLRIYNGRDAQGNTSMVLVGVDADFRDMTAGVMLNDHFRCPPWCPPEETSVLRE